MSEKRIELKLLVDQLPDELVETAIKVLEVMMGGSHQVALVEKRKKMYRHHWEVDENDELQHWSELAYACARCEKRPVIENGNLCEKCYSETSASAVQSCPHCGRPIREGLPCECDHHAHVRPIGIREEVDYEREWRAFRSVDDDPRPIDDLRVNGPDEPITLYIEAPELDAEVRSGKLGSAYAGRRKA